MKRPTLAALLLATAVSTSFAQSAGHDHQQAPKEAPAIQPPAPPPEQPGASSKMGMMGGGMMNNAGGKMSMMDMMQRMGMMRQEGGGMGMATIDRVEGRIAFLRTELKIGRAHV